MGAHSPTPAKSRSVARPRWSRRILQLCTWALTRSFGPWAKSEVRHALAMPFSELIFPSYEKKLKRTAGSSLGCNWPKCQSGFTTRSILTIIAHLRCRHEVEATYTALEVPSLPYPPKTTAELEQWGAKRKRGKVTIPPSQSQGTAIRRAPATLDPVEKDTLREYTGPRSQPPLLSWPSSSSTDISWKYHQFVVVLCADGNCLP